jgi:probable rRNA maturation factor
VIEFYFNDIEFILDTDKVSIWVKLFVESYDNEIDKLNVIFCTDEYLLALNREHLQHDYYTDIITFPYNEEPITADLFISYERVLENATTYKVTSEHELLRVIIHGVLHLLGFSDKNNVEQLNMRELEEEAIKKYYKMV